MARWRLMYDKNDNVLPPREGLELEKLQLEIDQLKVHWWRKPAFIMPVLVPLLGYGLASYEGVFDRARHRIERERDDLRTENVSLTHKNASLNLQVGSLVYQVDSLSTARILIEADLDSLRGEFAGLDDSFTISSHALEARTLELAYKRSELEATTAQVESARARHDSLQIRFFDAKWAIEIAAARLREYRDDSPIILGAPLEITSKDLVIYGLNFGNGPGELRLRVRMPHHSNEVPRPIASVSSGGAATYTFYTVAPPAEFEWRGTEIGVRMGDLIFAEIGGIYSSARADSASFPFVEFQVVRSDGKESEWFNIMFEYITHSFEELDSWDWEY